MGTIKMIRYLKIVYVDIRYGIERGAFTNNVALSLHHCPSLFSSTILSDHVIY